MNARLHQISIFCILSFVSISSRVVSAQVGTVQPQPRPVMANAGIQLNEAIDDITWTATLVDTDAAPIDEGTVVIHDLHDLGAEYLGNAYVERYAARASYISSGGAMLNVLGYLKFVTMDDGTTSAMIVPTGTTSPMTGSATGGDSNDGQEAGPQPAPRRFAAVWWIPVAACVAAQIACEADVLQAQSDCHDNVNEHGGDHDCCFKRALGDQVNCALTCGVNGPDDDYDHCYNEPQQHIDHFQELSH